MLRDLTVKEPAIRYDIGYINSGKQNYTGAVAIVLLPTLHRPPMQRFLLATVFLNPRRFTDLL